MATFHERPVELLQRLLRFDTRNPPGGEAECVAFIDELLRSRGLETRVLAADRSRPNLVARLPGAGVAPPLLLHGHVDVVPVEGQDWSQPPFGGVIADGCVWGRGALDMKGGVAMMLAALLRAHAERVVPAGDVVLAIVSDEEDGGRLGAGHLVDRHADLFAGVRYGIGEFGGFSVDLAGRRLYPVQVAEKQVCRVTATVRGAAGHGALPSRGAAPGKLAAFLAVLERKRLPTHVTPTARAMIEAIADAVPHGRGAALRLLLRRHLAGPVLDLLGERGRFFEPVLHNTVNVTAVHGGEAGNVVPAAITVELDGRVLPGFGAGDLLRELHALAGDDVELEVTRFDAGPSPAGFDLFETLAGVLRRADPTGVPVPMLLAGVTDARHFARLGIECYGFLPMRLPAGFGFTSLIHAADERIPVDALDFGAAALLDLLTRYCRDGG